MVPAAPMSRGSSGWPGQLGPLIMGLLLGEAFGHRSWCLLSGGVTLAVPLPAQASVALPPGPPVGLGCHSERGQGAKWTLIPPRTPSHVALDLQLHRLLGGTGPNQDTSRAMGSGTLVAREPGIYP